MTRNDTERTGACVSSGPVSIPIASGLDALPATALQAGPPTEARRRLGSASTLIAAEVERLGTYLKSLPERLSELGFGWELGDAEAAPAPLLADSPSGRR